jgi:hypothetical protein
VVLRGAVVGLLLWIVVVHGRTSKVAFYGVGVSFDDVGVCVVFGEVAMLLSGEVMLTWRIWWGISSGM